MKTLTLFGLIFIFGFNAHAVISQEQADEIKQLCLKKKDMEKAGVSKEQQPRLCECMARNYRYLVPIELYSALLQDWSNTLPERFEDSPDMILLGNLTDSLADNCLKNPNYFSPKAQREKDKLAN